MKNEGKDEALKHIILNAHSTYIIDKPKHLLPYFPLSETTPCQQITEEVFG